MRRVFKFISFFSFAVILLTGCDGNLPPEQKEFNPDYALEISKGNFI
jgi:hypothetical protein